MRYGDGNFGAGLGKDCGALTGTYDCNESRTAASCGACASGRYMRRGRRRERVRWHVGERRGLLLELRKELRQGCVGAAVGPTTYVIGGTYAKGNLSAAVDAFTP